jgi:hypothetical protein
LDMIVQKALHSAQRCSPRGALVVEQPLILMPPPSTAISSTQLDNARTASGARPWDNNSHPWAVQCRRCVSVKMNIPLSPSDNSCIGYSACGPVRSVRQREPSSDRIR